MQPLIALLETSLHLPFSASCVVPDQPAFPMRPEFHTITPNYLIEQYSFAKLITNELSEAKSLHSSLRCTRWRVQQLADVDQAMDRLIQQFETRTGTAFVLDNNVLDNEVIEDLPQGYNPDEMVSLWQVQTRFNRPVNTTAGLRRHLNPPAEHILPQFDGPRGARSNDIVDDTNLRHLLGCHTQADVDAALQEFNEFRPNTKIAVTVEDSLQYVDDGFGKNLINFTEKLPGLQKFGGLRLVYASRLSTIRYPQRDSVLQSSYHPAHSRLRTDCVFSARFRSSNRQIRPTDYDSFGLLTLELKKAQVRATAGLHLSGYCRPETDDHQAVQNIISELHGDSRPVDTSRKNFQETATQAFRGGVLNKCGMVAFMDPAGMNLMSVDNVQGLNQALRTLRLHRPSNQVHTMTVNYDRVHCMHWEDGTFWKDLTCAIVNQLYAEFPDLRECLDRYSRMQRGIQVEGGLDSYRFVRRDIDSHRRANNLYQRCCEYYHLTAPPRARSVLEPFGEFVERKFTEHEILETFHEFKEDVATSVYKVVLPAVNNGRPFVAKLHSLDEQGEGLFVNELKVYQHLMRQDRDPRLWPLLLEFGLAFVHGMPFYYLALEYLDGETPILRECIKCSNELTQYGITHDDVKTSNFVNVKDGKRKVVKAIDFGISLLAEAKGETPIEISS